tara:strand:- start:253 stop:519 length:267 start_codon:yes stop_codon:yes gene_type:complete
MWKNTEIKVKAVIEHWLESQYEIEARVEWALQDKDVSIIVQSRLTDFAAGELVNPLIFVSLSRQLLSPEADVTPALETLKRQVERVLE